MHSAKRSGWHLHKLGYDVSEDLMLKKAFGILLILHFPLLKCLSPKGSNILLHWYQRFG